MACSGGLPKTFDRLPQLIVVNETARWIQRWLPQAANKAPVIDGVRGIRKHCRPTDRIVRLSFGVKVCVRL